MFSYCSNSPVGDTDSEGNRSVKVNVSSDSRLTVKNKLITKTLDKKTPKQRNGFNNSRNGGKKADSSYRNDGFCGRGGYTTFTKTLDKNAAQTYINNFVINDPWQIVVGSLGDIGECVTTGALATGETIIEQVAWAGAITVPSVAGKTIRGVSDYQMWKTASDQIDDMKDDSLVQVSVLIWDTGDFTYSVSELG